MFETSFSILFLEFGHLNVIPKDKQERLKSTLLQLSSDTHPNLQMKANDLHTMLQ